MNKKFFATYTTDDFILDDDFRKIVEESGSTDQLTELIESLPEKKGEIKLAIKILRELQVESFQQSPDRKSEQWQTILRARKRVIRYFYLRVAASFLLLLGIGGALYYVITPKLSNENSFTNRAASSNATLILANGKKVLIQSKESKVKYSEDGSGIIVDDSASIAQSVSNEGLNQLIVPYGKRSYIVLSEGTRVWINSGSKLTFPPVFKGNTREVCLEGEALFEVAKNKEKPFYVKTDLFKIKVYGTKFNVQAYQNSNNYSVILVEGRVSMNSKGTSSQEVFLAPKQMATISTGKEKFEINNIESTEFYTSWVDGYLAFSNDDVTNVLKQVSRYYNIEIKTVLSGNVEKIYGKLDMKDDLKKVLDGIAFISKTKYEKQGETYLFLNN